MPCPQCGLETSENICPECGHARSKSAEKQEPSQPAITFTVTSKQPKDQVSSDWRAELRKKLRQHHTKKGTAGPSRPARTPARPTQPKAPEVKTKAPGSSVEEKPSAGPGIFEYKIKDEPKPKAATDRVVPLKSKPEERKADPTPAPKPAKPQPPVTKDSRQATLRLETAPKRSKSTVKSATPTPAVPDEPMLSSEILFTRILSCLLDAILWACVGGVFGFAAANLVGGVFLSSEWLRLSGICGIGLYLISTIFFLYSTGQTPGMMWTDLILESEVPGRSPDLIAIMIRTLLFPVLAATVIGLLWSLFDRRKRCWHDYISSTWVAPLLRD